MQQRVADQTNWPAQGEPNDNDEGHITVLLILHEIPGLSVAISKFDAERSNASFTPYRS